MLKDVKRLYKVKRGREEEGNNRGNGRRETERHFVE